MRKPGAWILYPVSVPPAGPIPLFLRVVVGLVLVVAGIIAWRSTAARRTAFFERYPGIVGLGLILLIVAITVLVAALAH
jgi:hypothetical protein